jgi:hypothetical protein
VLGEICPQCGQPVVILAPEIRNEKTGALLQALYSCVNPNCRLDRISLQTGQGRITHAICEACLLALRERREKQLTDAANLITEINTTMRPPKKTEGTNHE